MRVVVVVFSFCGSCLLCLFFVWRRTVGNVKPLCSVACYAPQWKTAVGVEVACSGKSDPLPGCGSCPVRIVGRRESVFPLLCCIRLFLTLFVFPSEIRLPCAYLCDRGFERFERSHGCEVEPKRKVSCDILSSVHWEHAHSLCIVGTTGIVFRGDQRTKWMHYADLCTCI